MARQEMMVTVNQNSVISLQSTLFIKRSPEGKGGMKELGPTRFKNAGSSRKVSLDSYTLDFCLAGCEVSNVLSCFPSLP